MNLTPIWEAFDKDRAPLSPISQELEEVDLCYKCATPLILGEDNFPTCSNTDCSLMLLETLDYSPEWRFFGNDDRNGTDPTRCGNPINPLLLESSFGCKVMTSQRSSYEMKKLRKWTEWTSMPHKEKSLYDEFQFITIMATNSGIPKIFIDDAVRIYKDISSQIMFRGCNRDGLKAASIYLSCRLNECPRTPDEIAEIFRLDKSSTTQGCSMAVRILARLEGAKELCQTSPMMFIERYCSKLMWNHEITMLCKFVAKKVEQGNLILDNTPHSTAAGIIYFVGIQCRQPGMNKMDIKRVCGVSEVTIHKCFKKLEAIRELLIPESVLSKYQTT